LMEVYGCPEVYISEKSQAKTKAKA